VIFHGQALYNIYTVFLINRWNVSRDFHQIGVIVPMPLQTSTVYEGQQGRRCAAGRDAP